MGYYDEVIARPPPVDNPAMCNMAFAYLSMLMKAVVHQNDNTWSLGELIITAYYASRGDNPEYRQDPVHLACALVEGVHLVSVEESNLREVFLQEFERGELAPPPENEVLQRQLMTIPGFAESAGEFCQDVANVLEDVFAVEWSREY